MENLHTNEIHVAVFLAIMVPVGLFAGGYYVYKLYGPFNFCVRANTEITTTAETANHIACPYELDYLDELINFILNLDLNETMFF